MEQSDIDAACASQLERGIEHVPGAAEDFAGEHAVAQYRAAEGLRHFDERVDDVSILDDVCGLVGAAPASLKGNDFGAAGQTHQAAIVDIDLEP